MITSLRRFPASSSQRNANAMSVLDERGIARQMRACTAAVTAES